MPETAAPKPIDELTDSELADLFGDAHLAVEQHENLKIISDQFRNELQRRHDLHAAKEIHFVQGLRWSVKLSARRKETTLTDCWAAYKAMKLNVREWVELAMHFVPMWFLEGKLGKDKLAGLVTTEQTGYRTVSAVARFAPVAATLPVPVELPTAA